MKQAFGLTTQDGRIAIVGDWVEGRCVSDAFRYAGKVSAVLPAETHHRGQPVSRCLITEVQRCGNERVFGRKNPSEVVVYADVKLGGGPANSQETVPAPEQAVASNAAQLSSAPKKARQSQVAFGKLIRPADRATA